MAIVWRAAGLALLAALAYASTISGPFLFDDENAVVRNSQIRQLWPPTIPLSPPRDTSVAGRPLVNLSLAINYAVHDLDVRGYHLVNITIHVLAALVLAGIVRRTLSACAPSLSPDSRLNVAWVAAAFWLLHPIQTEPVNYIVQRAESMMGLAYLGTLYASIRAWDDTHRGLWRAVAIAACAAGMACKESMVTAPIAVLLYDLTYSGVSFRKTWRARRGFYGGLAATVAIVIALMYGSPRAAVGFDSGISASTYLLNQMEMLTTYLRLVVWPRDLVLDYGPPRLLAISDVVPQMLVVLAVAMATVVMTIRDPRIGFLGVWFFLTLAPTTSFVPIATEVGAERRMYLALATPCILAALGTAVALRRNRSYALLAVVVLAALGAATIARNMEYQSRLAMAETISQRRPSGKAHYIVGVELLRVGRRAEGIRELQAAAPEYPDARYAVGTELMEDRRFDDAIPELCEFVRLRPLHPNVMFARDQLGRAYLAKGELGSALQQFEVVLGDSQYRWRTEVLAMTRDIQDFFARRGYADRAATGACHA